MWLGQETGHSALETGHSAETDHSALETGRVGQFWQMLPRAC
jgi:hypothetical protein